MAKLKTRRHGLLDYAAGALLMLPWTTNFNEREQDTWMLGAAGLLIILYSVMTDYEMGLMKLLPMKAHLVLDVLVALFLMASPFIFPVYNYYFYWPMLLGVLLFTTALLSSSAPYRVNKKDLNITQP